VVRDPLSSSRALARLWGGLQQRHGKHLAMMLSRYGGTCHAWLCLYNLRLSDNVPPDTD
jgi:hypothetical protein